MNTDQAKTLSDSALTKLMEALEHGQSETLKSYLAVMSRFHRYSWNNALLIYMQRPNATHVAGFQAWLRMRRYPPMSSYAEISPSGDGIHVLIRAQLGTAGRRTTGVEVYAAGRYFTMTGKHLDGTPDRIEQRQQELDVLLQELFPPESEPPQSKATPRLGLSDSALIEKALEAKSGPRFRKLWSGDTSDYDGDHSRADAALCRMLSFWTGGDPERIDRLFRLSGLMRGKWDRRTGRETYGARTIRISSRLRAH